KLQTELDLTASKSRHRRCLALTEEPGDILLRYVDESICMVKCILSIEPKLKVHPFCEIPFLRNRQVNIPESRSTKLISLAHIAGKTSVFPRKQINEIGAPGKSFRNKARIRVIHKMIRIAGVCSDRALIRNRSDDQGTRAS